MDPRRLLLRTDLVVNRTAVEPRNEDQMVRGNVRRFAQRRGKVLALRSRSAGGRLRASAQASANEARGRCQRCRRRMGEEGRTLP